MASAKMGESDTSSARPVEPAQEDNAPIWLQEIRREIKEVKADNIALLETIATADAAQKALQRRVGELEVLNEEITQAARMAVDSSRDNTIVLDGITGRNNVRIQRYGVGDRNIEVVGQYYGEMFQLAKLYPEATQQVTVGSGEWYKKSDPDTDAETLKTFAALEAGIGSSGSPYIWADWDTATFTAHGALPAVADYERHRCIGKLVYDGAYLKGFDQYVDEPITDGAGSGGAELGDDVKSVVIDGANDPGESDVVLPEDHVHQFTTSLLVAELDGTEFPGNEGTVQRAYHKHKCDAVGGVTWPGGTKYQVWQLTATGNTDMDWDWVRYHGSTSP